MKIFAIFLFFTITLNTYAQQTNTPYADDDRIGIGTDAPEAELSVKGELQLIRTNDDAFSPSSKISFQTVDPNGSPVNWFLRNEHEESETPLLTFYEEEGKPRFQLRGSYGWSFRDENDDLEIYSDGNQGGGIYIPGTLNVGDLSVGSFGAYYISSTYLSSNFINSSGGNISLLSPAFTYKTNGGSSFSGVAHSFSVNAAMTNSNAKIATFSNGGAALVSIDKSGNINSSGKIDATGDISTTSKMKVGIGSLNIGTHSLAVNGSAIFTKAHVKLTTNWPDYVFGDDYELPTLTYIESFIKKNKHLPGVPTAEQIEKEGIDLGDTQAILLKKIEELTLYIIEQNKRIEKLEKLVQ